MKDQYYVQQYVLSKMRQDGHRLWSGMTVFLLVPPHPPLAREQVSSSGKGKNRVSRN